MYMDDFLSSSLIEALQLFCKLRLRDATSLQLLDNDEVEKVVECIKEDDTEFMDSADPSVIWSAIISGFSAVPILDISSSNSTTDDIVNDLSENYKRASGSLLCTSELLIEFHPRNAQVIVQSLYKALISPVLYGHSNTTTFLFNLLQDYKMYFPYMYTFCRRIGRSPNMTLQQWREALFPDMPETENNVQALTADWDMSGLEEGEDSDGEDQASLKATALSAVSPKPKRATRMSSLSRRSPQKQTIKDTQEVRSRHRSDSADVLMQTMSSTDDMVMEIQDMSFGSVTSDQGRSVPSHRGARDVGSPIHQQSRHQYREREGSSSTSQGGNEEVTLEDLRAAFEQSLDEDSDLAEKGKLARNLRYNAGIPSVAAAVQRFHDIEISWDELKDLAGPYIKKSPPLLNVRDDISDVHEDIPDIIEYHTDKNVSHETSGKNLYRSEWANTRVYHNVQVESVEGLPQESLQSSNLPTTVMDKHSDVDQQTSPYLSIPKQPPQPQMSPLQIGEYLFREADRNADGTISQLELIKSLRSHPDLAKRLKLPSKIRQEDGSRDDFVECFHAMDTNESGAICLDEFLQFLRENSSEYSSHRPQPSKTVGLLPSSRWEDKQGGVASRREGGWAGGDADRPNLTRLSATSEDILGASGGRQRGGSPMRDTRSTDADRLSYESAVASPMASAQNGRSTASSPVAHRGELYIDTGSNPPGQENLLAQSMPNIMRADPSINSRNNPGKNSVPSEERYRHSRLPANARSASPVGWEASRRPPLHRGASAGDEHALFKKGQNVPAEDVKIPSPDKHHPPPPTELGAEMHVILEGFLEKKSTVTGMYQKRYFVLAFGSILSNAMPLSRGHTSRIELRIFKKYIESAWGTVPIGLTRVIDIESIEEVTALPNKKKIDTIFTIRERLKTATSASRELLKSNDRPVDQSLDGKDENVINVERQDSMDSACSDHQWTGKNRVTTLRATDPEARLLWINTLRKSMGIVNRSRLLHQTTGN